MADPEDFEALYALEALTNDRVRDEVGKIELVAPADRLFGPGSGPIMAAFTHLNPQGSRFSDGSYGVFYAGKERATAVAETRHHHGRFLRATGEGSMHLPMRLYHVDIDSKLHDLRLDGVVDARINDQHSYDVSRAGRRGPARRRLQRRRLPQRPTSRRPMRGAVQAEGCAQLRACGVSSLCLGRNALLGRLRADRMSEQE